MLKKKTLFWYFWGEKVYVYKIHFMTKHNLNSNICILATVALVKYERTNKGMCVRGFEWSLFCLNFERIGKGKQYICIFLRENLWAVFLNLRFLWTFSIDTKAVKDLWNNIFSHWSSLIHLFKWKLRDSETQFSGHLQVGTKTGRFL